MSIKNHGDIEEGWMDPIPAAPAEGLDFERAPYGYSNKPRPRIEAFEGRLNAQHLAIVARVRAETRRETLIEVRQEVVSACDSLVRSTPAEQAVAIRARLVRWLDSHLQVSP